MTAKGTVGALLLYFANRYALFVKNVFLTLNDYKADLKNFHVAINSFD
jgi:hypothetical protein